MLHKLKIQNKMTSIKKQTTLIIAALFAFLLTTSGQAAIELNFQGLLTDASGEIMAGESFDLSVILNSSESGKNELWSYSEASTTDENGWFTYSIPEISQFLETEQNEDNSLVIKMEFLPNSNTKWLSEDEDFLVSYTITAYNTDDAIKLTLSRMEGAELTSHVEDHLFAFKDDYPFAYLTAGFLLTDSPPLNKTSIDDLRQWILPESSEIDSTTRGVKGGFPKGGYRKR